MLIAIVSRYRCHTSNKYGERKHSYPQKPMWTTVVGMLYCLVKTPHMP